MSEEIKKPKPVKERRRENIKFFQKTVAKEAAASFRKGGLHAVEVTRPELACLALDMRVMGETLTAIKTATGIDYSTIRKLCRRHQDGIEERKLALSEDHSYLAEMYMEAQHVKAQRLLDDPEKLDAICPSKLAITTAIHTDKHLGLRGQASVVVEHRKGASIEDAQATLDDMRAKLAKRANGEVVDVPLESDDFVDEDGDVI